MHAISGDARAGERVARTDYALGATFARGVRQVERYATINRQGDVSIRHCARRRVSGLAQAKPGAFLGLDYWGVFLRRSELKHASFSNGLSIAPSPSPYPNNVVTSQGVSSEDRTVVDFEVGKDLGIGSGANLRAIAGLRYARQHSRLAFGATTKEGYYGGKVCGPVFKDIAERCASYLNIAADPNLMATNALALNGKKP